MADPHDDDLEPVPLAPGATPPVDEGDRPSSSATTASPTAVRDRFLVALAIVVGVALVALGVQLRSIAADTRDNARCTKALVAVVASSFRDGPDERSRIEDHLQTCLGPGTTLPGVQEG